MRNEILSVLSLMLLDAPKWVSGVLCNKLWASYFRMTIVEMLSFALILAGLMEFNMQLIREKNWSEAATVYSFKKSDGRKGALENVRGKKQIKDTGVAAERS